jgi:hypothetical protein
MIRINIYRFFRYLFGVGLIKKTHEYTHVPSTMTFLDLIETSSMLLYFRLLPLVIELSVLYIIFMSYISFNTVPINSFHNIIFCISSAELMRVYEAIKTYKSSRNLANVN